MNRSINLIPAPRRRAKACRARLRNWLTACIGYGGLLAVIALVCQASWRSRPAALADEITRTEERIRTSERTIADLKKELAANQWKLDSCLAVGKQPDWSILLAVLADCLGDEIVLKTCQLTPAGDSPTKRPSASAKDPAAPRARGDGGFVFLLSGLGRSQTAVSQFVLRLESAGLFDRVTLIKTNRETFVKGKAVAFQLECLLTGKERPAP